MNREQVKCFPHFTEMGFKHTKVPPASWAEIKDFFERNRYREINEGWKIGDAYTNFWDTPTTIVTLTDAMRKKIWKGAKPLLEEWSGVHPLVPTFCYAIRLYHNGSLLFNHADRLETHAVSAIIDVAQEELEEPWPLEIQDHEGNSYEVITWSSVELGEMVFYENAAAIHGREIRPLKGKAMANLFVHFKPAEESSITWDYKYK